MSFWRTYYHLVWATRERRPLITQGVEARLFPYLVNKAAEMDVRVYAVNGWVDHIHMVVAIPPKLAVAEVVKTLKGASAHDVNAQMQPLASGEPHFAWQGGYGVLTIGERHRYTAVEYVQRQKEHHATGQTNAWLERYDDADCGPSDPGAATQPLSRVLREAEVLYGQDWESGTDAPF